MNARTVIKASLVAALFAAGAAAQAAPMGEGDTQSSQAVQVQSSHAFVANSQRGSLASFNEGFGSNVHAAGSRSVDRNDVRQAAIQAERNGSIDRGDAMTF